MHEDLEPQIIYSSREDDRLESEAYLITIANNLIRLGHPELADKILGGWPIAVN